MIIHFCFLYNNSFVIGKSNYLKRHSAFNSTEILIQDQVKGMFNKYPFNLILASKNEFYF